MLTRVLDSLVHLAVYLHIVDDPNPIGHGCSLATYVTNIIPYTYNQLLTWASHSYQGAHRLIEYPQILPHRPPSVIGFNYVLSHVGDSFRDIETTRPLHHPPPLIEPLASFTSIMLLTAVVVLGLLVWSLRHVITESCRKYTIARIRLSFLPTKMTAARNNQIKRAAKETPMPTHTAAEFRDNSHAKAAATRYNSSGFISNFAAMLQMRVYELNPSATNVKRGNKGRSEAHTSHDLESLPKMADVFDPDRHIMTSVDVFQHMSTSEISKTIEDAKIVAIADFDPHVPAHIGDEVSWNVKRDDTVAFRSLGEGQAEWKHRIPDYTPDNSQYLWTPVTFMGFIYAYNVWRHIPRATDARERTVRILYKLDRVYRPFGFLFRNKPVIALKKFVHGDVAMIEQHLSKRTLVAISSVSSALTTGLSVVIPVDELVQLVSFAQQRANKAVNTSSLVRSTETMKDKSIDHIRLIALAVESVAACNEVARWTRGEDAEAMTIYKRLRHIAINSGAHVRAEDEKNKVKGGALCHPLTNDVPANMLDSDTNRDFICAKRTINPDGNAKPLDASVYCNARRFTDAVMGLKDPDGNAVYDGTAADRKRWEYADRIRGQVKPLEPFEVYEKFSKPGQRTQLDQVFEAPQANAPHVAFIKNEAAGLTAKGRQITPVSNEQKMESARYMYAIVEVLKVLLPCYAFGKSPADLTEHMADTRTHCLEMHDAGYLPDSTALTDFSDFDGTQGQIALVYVKMLCLAILHPDYHAGFNKIFDDVRTTPTIFGCFRVLGGLRQRSGSMFTSFDNTILCAASVFEAFVRQNRAFGIAISYRSIIGILTGCGGDDCIAYGLLAEHAADAGNALGFVTKAKQQPLTTGFYDFLARWWHADHPRGTQCSIRRTLRSITFAANLPQSQETQDSLLADKMMMRNMTDRHTPIIRVLLDFLNPPTATEEDYESEFVSFNSRKAGGNDWPNEITDCAESVAAFQLEMTVDEIHEIEHSAKLRLDTIDGATEYIDRLQQLKELLKTGPLFDIGDEPFLELTDNDRTDTTILCRDEPLPEGDTRETHPASTGQGVDVPENPPVTKVVKTKKSRKKKKDKVPVPDLSLADSSSVRSADSSASSRR